MVHSHSIFLAEILEKSVAQLVKILGKPDRTYKDQIFRMLLKDRKTALEVYNAMNGTDYSNPDDLIITTLENAIYLGMKNDKSFMKERGWDYDCPSLSSHAFSENPVSTH